MFIPQYILGLDCPLEGTLGVFFFNINSRGVFPSKIASETLRDFFMEVAKHNATICGIYPSNLFTVSSIINKTLNIFFLTSSFENRKNVTP